MQVYHKKDFSCIPEDYLVISEHHYQEDQETIIGCKATLEHAE